MTAEANSKPQTAKPQTELNAITNAGESGWQRFASNATTIGGAVLLAIFIRIVLFEAFEIDGPSMEPTLLHGDRVVVAKFMYGLFLPQMDEAVTTWGAPDVGDVVIVKSPADNVDIVKRVIGVGGDTIEIRDGVVHRNGAPVPVEEIGDCPEGNQKNYDSTCSTYEERIDGRAYRISRSRHEPQSSRPPIEIPAGHVYVLGDHRDRSNDSRNHLIAAVPVSRIKGKALFVYLSLEAGEWFQWWSRSRWGRFGMSVR